MEDSHIVALFTHRAEKAIEETEKKYGSYCHRIAHHVLEDDEDAKEIVNDTYLRLWNTIPPQNPQNFKAYVATVCQRLALDRYDAGKAQKRGGGQVDLVLDELAECIPDGAESHMSESLALRDALNAFLEKLPQRTRILFVQRYWYLTPLSEIAKTCGEQEGAVAMLMLRTRKKLKAFLKKEGFDL
ncbi:MAG: sigma-70 family RNA polymerase sigma factor [Clostridia bacterium]|nr:sigma-70 family RNA polymerase sigma factor [Clostridia bacterium]